MPVTARTPRCGLTVGTVPSGTVDSNYPPTQFTVGELLFVPSGPSAGALYQLELSNAATPARFWFPINSGSGPVTQDGLSPMWFSGRVTGSLAVIQYLGLDPFFSAGTQRRYRRARAATNVVARRLHVFPVVNTMTVNMAVDIVIAGVVQPSSALAIGAGVTGAVISGPVANLAFADGDSFDVRISGAGGADGTLLQLTAVIEFGVV